MLAPAPNYYTKTVTWFEPDTKKMPSCRQPRGNAIHSYEHRNPRKAAQAIHSKRYREGKRLTDSDSGNGFLRGESR